MFAQLWRSRLRYYQRFHGPVFNRALHLVVRRGLAHATRYATERRLAAVEPVSGR